MEDTETLRDFLIKLKKKPRVALKCSTRIAGKPKWNSLRHHGVMFPPSYQFHGIKMLYGGTEVDLTPEQEEIATMYAELLYTEYAEKPMFNKNFFQDWTKYLGTGHLITSFEHCDFHPIYKWVQDQKEKAYGCTEDKKKEDAYKWAFVNGTKLEVKGYKIRAPGLFQGRGNHPKIGRLQKRILPSDITINISKEYEMCLKEPAERWKEVCQRQDVIWLARWKEPLFPNQFKYMEFADNSALKIAKDIDKFDKARELKTHIIAIRADIAQDFTHHFEQRRKLAVVIYLIDKLALRVGNEKKENTADTVGCCTLEVQNVKLKEPTTLEFDFVGKDSIPFDKRILVEREVFRAIKGFCEGKEARDLIFDGIKPTHVNAHLEHYMHGLTARVFRTYQASMLLDERLTKQFPKDAETKMKIAYYKNANAEVATLLNHRQVRKVNEEQIAHLIQSIEKKKVTLAQLEAELAHDNDRERFEGKVLKIRKEIERMEKKKQKEEYLFRLALGTSKKNYLDPRITFSWCRREGVPSEEIFSKSLIKKFLWAEKAEADYRF